MFIYVDCLGSMTLVDIWNQMITPRRQLNQSDDMSFITQPVEKQCWHHQIKQARRPKHCRSGSVHEFGEISYTQAAPLEDTCGAADTGKSKASLACNEANEGFCSESRLLVCVHVRVLTGPALGLVLNYSLNWVWFLSRMNQVQVDGHHNTRADCFHQTSKLAAGFETSWRPSSPAKIGHRAGNDLIGPVRRDSWRWTAIYGYISILLTCLRSTPGVFLELRWYLNPARAEVEWCLSVSHLR